VIQIDPIFDLDSQLTSVNRNFNLATELGASKHCENSAWLIPPLSTRSHLSPGNTPPHILHQKTLLDIDVEGQSQDATQPLVLHQPKPTLTDLEREFLH